MPIYEYACEHCGVFEEMQRINDPALAKCPKCKEGDIIEKRSRKGRNFYACSRYPDCDFAMWSKPTGENCPTCGNLLVYAKDHKIACSDKECGFSKEAPQKEE